jgi:hypothetical protein
MAQDPLLEIAAANKSPVGFSCRRPRRRDEAIHSAFRGQYLTFHVLKLDKEEDGNELIKYSVPFFPSLLLSPQFPVRLALTDVACTGAPSP